MPVVRSAYLKAPWQLELRDIDLPNQPPEGHLLLKIDACGLCGTDLTSAKDAKDWGPVGHEIAGTIVTAGPGCPKHLMAGLTVVLISSSFCGHCSLCHNGHRDLCNRGPNFWSQQAMGFSDMMIAPAAAAVPYTGLDPVLACQAEPVGVSLDLLKTADIRLGESVCVVGPSPIGLVAAGLALRSGAVRVLTVGCSRHVDRLAFAASLGSGILATEELLDSLTHVRHQFDHVLVTAPTDTIAPALSLLAIGGRLSFLGIGTHGGESVSTPTISISANCNYAPATPARRWGCRWPLTCCVRAWCLGNGWPHTAFRWPRLVKRLRPVRTRAKAR